MRSNWPARMPASSRSSRCAVASTDSPASRVPEGSSIEYLPTDGRHCSIIITMPSSVIGIKTTDPGCSIMSFSTSGPPGNDNRSVRRLNLPPRCTVRDELLRCLAGRPAAFVAVSVRCLMMQPAVRSSAPHRRVTDPIPIRPRHSTPLECQYPQPLRALPI